MQYCDRLSQSTLHTPHSTHHACHHINDNLLHKRIEQTLSHSGSNSNSKNGQKSLIWLVDWFSCFQITSEWKPVQRESANAKPFVLQCLCCRWPRCSYTCSMSNVRHKAIQVHEGQRRNEQVRCQKDSHLRSIFIIPSALELGENEWEHNGMRQTATTTETRYTIAPATTFNTKAK